MVNPGPPPVPLQAEHLHLAPPMPDGRNSIMSPTSEAGQYLEADGRSARRRSSSKETRLSVSQQGGAAQPRGAAPPPTAGPTELEARLKQRNDQLKKQVQLQQSELRTQLSRTRRLEHRVVELETASGVRAGQENERAEEWEEEKRLLTDERDHLQRRVQRLGEQAARYPQLERALADLYFEFVGATEEEAEEESATSAHTRARPRHPQLNPMALIDYLRCGLRGVLQVNDDAATDLRRSLARAERKTEQVSAARREEETAFARVRSECDFDQDSVEKSKAQETQRALQSVQQELSNARTVILELRKENTRLEKDVLHLRDGLEEREKALCERDKIALKVPVLEKQLEKYARARAMEESAGELRLRNQIRTTTTKLQQLQEKVLKADDAIQRNTQLEKQVKELRRAPMQKLLVDVTKERDKYLRSSRERQQEVDRVRKEMGELKRKLSVSKHQWQARFDTMTEKYQELFVSIHREQQERVRGMHVPPAVQREQERNGRQPAVGGTQFANPEEEVQFWKARVEDAQREAQVLCQQLKRCVLHEHRENGRFEAAKEDLLAVQRRLEQTVSRLRERLAEAHLDEDSDSDSQPDIDTFRPNRHSKSPVSPGVPTAPKGRGQMGEWGSSFRTPTQAVGVYGDVLIHPDGVMDSSGNCVLSPESVAAGEEIRVEDVCLETSVRAVRRPKKDFERSTYIASLKKPKTKLPKGGRCPFSLVSPQDIAQAQLRYSTTPTSPTRPESETVTVAAATTPPPTTILKARPTSGGGLAAARMRRDEAAADTSRLADSLGPRTSTYHLGVRRESSVGTFSVDSPRGVRRRMMAGAGSGTTATTKTPPEDPPSQNVAASSPSEMPPKPSAVPISTPAVMLDPE
eukprot:Hpha_TRINITY_DN30629_c0_g1::TRINITY_DN30629_c0_g1_i1::g.18325::m.18325